MDLSHKIYKKFSRPFVKACVKLRISANALTIFNFFLTVGAGCYFFSQNLYLYAFLIMAINVFLDYLDGDVAKSTNTLSGVGVWLDSYGDVIVQNAIMGAIGLGCIKLGLPVVIVVVFFVANSSLNMVSFHYNNTFGFDSYTGSELFRMYMDKKKSIFNRIFKNLIDPTASWIGLSLYTVRYWILIGMVWNMPLMFILITILHSARAIFMYIIYALHLAQYKKLWLSQALAILDNERQEYHNIRGSK